MTNNLPETAETVPGRIASKVNPSLGKDFMNTRAQNIHEIKAGPLNDTLNNDRNRRNILKSGIKQSSRANVHSAFAEIDIPKKLHIGGKVETAERYIKKEVNPDTGRIKYIYQKHLDRDKAKLTKELLKNKMPEKLRLKSPTERTFSIKEQKITKAPKELIKGGKADYKPDSNYNKKQIAKGMNVEKEHTNNPKIAKEISKDHLQESPEYYKELEKMEKKLETADGAPGREWKWSKHKYQERKGPKGEYRYNYRQQTPVTDEEEMGKRNLRDGPAKQHQPDRAIKVSPEHFNRTMNNSPKPTATDSMVPPKTSSVGMGTSQGGQPNPSGGQPNPPDGIRYSAAPPGMGRHQQQAQIQPSEYANPVNQGMGAGSREGSNMADQAKNAGNVFNSDPDVEQQKFLPSYRPGVNPGDIQAPEKNPAQSAIGQMMENVKEDTPPGTQTGSVLGVEDINAQDNPMTNPLHPEKLGPMAATRYGDCHKMALQKAMSNGGQVYTTAGSKAGKHSIAINPDGTVYDYVLGIDNMPQNEYFQNVPYIFSPKQPNVMQ